MSETGALAPTPTPAAGTTSGELAASPQEDRGRIFPCPSCGADLEFHIGQQKLACPFCGFAQDLAPEAEEISERDLEATLEHLAELRRRGVREEAETQEVDCPACGATVTFVGTLTSTECPYCASPIQRQAIHRAEGRLPADGVLPFLVDERRARENVRRWVGSRWFAPNKFKKHGVRGQLHGTYLPYWTYDAMTFCRYSGQRGEHYYERRGGKRVRRTRWYPASGSFQRFFDDVLVVASRGLPANLMLGLEPWPLERCRGFHQELLAGHTARTYDIPLDQGLSDARRRIENALRAETRQRIGGDAQRIHQMDTRYSALTYKHLLLPVWTLPYRYGDRVYQVVVNAASGEVQGQRPWSVVKILLLVITVLLLLYLFS